MVDRACWGGASVGGTFARRALPGEGPGRDGRGLAGGGAFGAGRRNTHSTARAEPFTVWDLGQRRVEAVQVVGGGAGVAAEQLAAVLAHATELHVVVLLFLAAALLLVVLVVLRLPLDPLLLLEGGSPGGGTLDQDPTSTRERLPPSHSHFPMFCPRRPCRSPEARHRQNPAPARLPRAYTVGTAPLALGSFLQLWVQADEVVGPRAGVAQDDLPTLLAHLTVVLVVRLIAITVINCGGGRGSRGGPCSHSQCTANLHPRLPWRILGAR